jgi:hypothetical protein
MPKDNNFGHHQPQHMTPEQITQFIQGGEWTSLTTEVRPSQNKSASGDIQPFYCSRIFRYTQGNKFQCIVTNYADASGKLPLVKIDIKGHNVWRGEHPLAAGAYNLDYVADEAYQVTPLHQGFADAVNTVPATGINKWQVGVMQNLLAKTFSPFGLKESEIYVDYDLIYIAHNMLFNGSKNVDGRAFDKPENRPTNLQVPLVRL